MDKCQICEREMKPAERDDLNGLIWLSPDDIWICPSCFKHESLKNMRIAQ